MINIEPNRNKVFLSTPISSTINPNTGLMESDIAVKINKIFDMLSTDYEVFLAIDREKWGLVKVTAKECTERDYRELKESAHLVAIICDYFSEGVLIELGWASALKIPITIIADKNVKLSPLVLGLLSVSDTRIYQVNWKEDEIYLDLILKDRLPK
ncbi:nucleoside 2-deoxyribosyltransferase [Clostridiaceae bacterium M8S5]|nr:nucleoside 2-deoxyribosyltransferase [Clostridiaceae bacterium M8S5]